MNILNLNKAFESRIRLGVMSVLAVNKAISFNELKDLLQITDGNLASHLKTLEDCGYITVTKTFAGRKTNTSYSATSEGMAAFREHLNILEEMIRKLS